MQCFDSNERDKDTSNRRQWKKKFFIEGKWFQNPKAQAVF